MTDAKCQLERDLEAAKQIPVDCIVVFNHQTWSSRIEMESITGVPAEDNTYIIDAACAAPRLAAEVERLRGFIRELAEYLDNSSIECVPAERQLVEFESMLSSSGEENAGVIERAKRALSAPVERTYTEERVERAHAEYHNCRAIGCTLGKHLCGECGGKDD